MTELEQARASISQVDQQMAALFQQRMEACKVVAEYKMQNGLSIKDADQEAAVIKRNLKHITNPDMESYYVQFIQNCMDISCNYQSQLMHGMKVVYSGTEGAYAYIAARKMFPSAQLISVPNFDEAYKGVEEGKYDCCVLPLENSYAGEVGAVMDLIFSGNLFVNQMMDLPISHNLMTVKGANLKDIKTVVSHPQALSQCNNYIKKTGVQTITYSNTALAAKYVKELNDKTVAAIASEETAELMDLEILERGINDTKNNTTRFGVFSRAQNMPLIKGKRSDEHFCLVFTVKNEAGALAQTINIIGAHGYNMHTVRSRPMKDLQWAYYFYIEAEGNINNQNGQDMLNELSVLCAKLKLVGSYFDVKA